MRAVRLEGRKIYIGGISTHLHSTNLPAGSRRWSVGTHLLRFLNPTGGGCNAAGCYTLLPREWVKQCFPHTGRYFRLFMRILGLHPSLMPRGEDKIPVYDKGTPETYVIVGTSAKRYGKGLRLVDRKLKEEVLQKDREHC